MKIYNAIKIAADGRIPTPVKLLGLAAMIAAKRRYLGVFIDPVLVCNLQCMMCYFSDKEKRASMHGIISKENLDAAQRTLFGRAVKLQIGCGAEPTLYSGLPDLIRRGKNEGVPYISLTTNGQLIGNGRIDLEELVEAGLNEITLSMHGADKETYEFLMPGAYFDNLLNLIGQLASIKKKHPDFKLRVNFTINSRNILNLTPDKFWTLWKDVQPDILQLRPVQNLGNSVWQDFDLSAIKEHYDETIGALANDYKRLGLTIIAPSLKQLDSVDDSQSRSSSMIEDVTYCYVDPNVCYKEDFDPTNETLDAYNKRKGIIAKIIKCAFGFGSMRSKNKSKKLNYRVE